MNTPNARFHWNDTTITLTEGQRLSHHQSEPTDEGWHYSAVTFQYNHPIVYAECASGGVDCDGRLDRYSDLCLDVSTPESIGDGFQLESSSQRDQYAELMNY